MHDNIDRSDRALRFERRTERRDPLDGSATVMYSDGDGRVGVGSVELIDVSDRGMGVRSSVPIDAGMIVTLYPTTRGPGPSSVDAIATHCEPARANTGWNIGLRVTQRLAA